ncbi:MAG: ABC transporter permease [Cyanobacteria bacterium SIG30]|nr:ABC transporter permease [Cyanobacteria bacterium SIG30]
MIKFLGQCVENLITAVKYMFSGTVAFSNVICQAASIGYDSLSISLTIVFIASSVIALQISNQFLMTGAESYIGGFLTIALIREIAPGFAALAIGARAGTAITAEMANMKVTSQVDAMNVLKVNPIGYYFAPRILASSITCVFVVVLAELVGVIAGAIIAYCVIGLHPDRYFNSVWLMLNTKDIYVSLLKGAIFGIIIADVCSTVGYNTQGGAKNVGESTTKSAILCTVYLLVADLIIGFLFYGASIG